MSDRPIVRDVMPPGGGPIAAMRWAARNVRPHAHPRRSTHGHAVVALVTAGRAVIDQNGEHRMHAGDVMIVPAGSQHRIVDRDRLEQWGVSFAAPVIAATDSAPLLDPIERVRDGACGVVSIPAERHAYLESLFREIASVSARRGATIDLEQRSLLALVLAEIGRTATTSAAPRKPGVVADALRHIERHCCGSLSVDDLATAVGRSATYVTTALTQATGRSALQWILAGRMAEARRLLLHTDEMVDVIAERVGYADATHFIRLFRREHGATPAAWRTAHAR